MKKLTALISVILVSACTSDRGPDAEAEGPATQPEFSVSESGIKTKNVEGFGGVIAESYQDSQEWWAEEELPNEDAPNIIIFLLDDVGFAQVESFGGLISTPNIDKLAANGLRYNNFHTTALCSPSRATLMAGRNPHSIGLGSHALTAMGFPGYNAIMPESAKSVANNLQEEGYVNYALGKWDHTPLYEVSQVGPFDRTIREILVQMDGLAVRLRRMVVPHDWHELVYVNCHERVSVLEAFAARPAIERADLRHFVERRVIPLAQRVIHIAFFLQVIRN